MMVQGGGERGLSLRGPRTQFPRSSPVCRKVCNGKSLPHLFPIVGEIDSLYPSSAPSPRTGARLCPSLNNLCETNNNNLLTFFDGVIGWLTLI